MIRTALLPAVVGLAAGLTLLPGCASPRPPMPRPLGPEALIDPVPGPDAVRRHPMFDGTNGRRLTWTELQPVIEWADVVVLGERHDDGVAHAIQLAIVEDALARRGARVAVALEMLERDEQALVDDYLDDLIEQEVFVRGVSEAKWWESVERYLDGDDDGEGQGDRAVLERALANVGWFDWYAFYQPVIDAAKDADAPVIAANAPWRYMRLGRRLGYDALRAFTAEQRRNFALPREQYRTMYWDRFADLMAGEEASTEEREEVRPMFRSQLIWDATMADSIARTLRRGEADQVILLVGAFHMLHEGGTVLELRRRLPHARILTIDLNPADATTLLDEDRGSADVVIYTAHAATPEPPAEPDPAPAPTTQPEPPASQPETDPDDKPWPPPTPAPDPAP